MKTHHLFVLYVVGTLIALAKWVGYPFLTVSGTGLFDSSITFGVDNDACGIALILVVVAFAVCGFMARRMRIRSGIARRWASLAIWILGGGLMGLAFVQMWLSNGQQIGSAGAAEHRSQGVGYLYLGWLFIAWLTWPRRAARQVHGAQQDATD